MRSEKSPVGRAEAAAYRVRCRLSLSTARRRSRPNFARGGPVPHSLTTVSVRLSLHPIWRGKIFLSSPKSPQECHVWGSSKLEISGIVVQRAASRIGEHREELSISRGPGGTAFRWTHGRDPIQSTVSGSRVWNGIVVARGCVCWHRRSWPAARFFEDRIAREGGR